MSVFTRVEGMDLYNYGVTNGKINLNQIYLIRMTHNDITGMTHNTLRICVGATPISIAPGTESLAGAIKSNEYIRIDESGAPKVLKADSVITTVTNFVLLSTEWVGTAAPYTQSVTIAGVTPTSSGTISLKDGFTDDEFNQSAESSIIKHAQSTDTLTFKAMLSKPTIDINMSIIT